MAKLCMWRREKKRILRTQRTYKRRKALTQRLKDPSVSLEDKEAIHLTLHKMGRDSSPTRVTRRCMKTGRPRGVYRRFGLGRQMIREQFQLGNIPGMVKSSW